MVKYCSNCGTEIGENDKFCKSCATQLSVKKIEATGKSYSRFLVIAVLVIVVLAALYLFTSETRTIAISVPYQEAVYETRQVEVAVPYQVAVYGTVYSGTIGEYSITGTIIGLITGTGGGSTKKITGTIDKATSYTMVYQSKGYWGDEYLFTVCWVSLCQDYPKIQFWELEPSTIITGYETKYRTEYKTEAYLARYETKYRTEYRDVTKTKVEWLMGV